MTHNILAAGEEPNPLVPHLSEIILVLIIFGILYYLVWKYVVPRFEANFAARKDAIEGGIARAEAAQAEAAQALAEYQHQLADARGEAAQIRENGRAEAQRIVEELRAQAQQESDRIVARGEEQLQTQRGQVVRDVPAEHGVQQHDHTGGQHQTGAEDQARGEGELAPGPGESQVHCWSAIFTRVVR